MFTIGEFSKITGLTIKSLRFYHEEGILSPSFVDPHSGYRYYDEGQIEIARAIAHLRRLEFPLSEIREILRCRDREEDLLAAIERHRADIEQKARHFRQVARSLETFLSQERQVHTMLQESFQVQEKTLEPQLIAGIRMRGCYGDCGRGFGRLGRSFGRVISGKPFLLHYDTEYREKDADFEACFPIRQARTAEGVSVRELPGGRCVSLLHKGPYEELGHSYAEILTYIKTKGYQVLMPTREVYHKGPGMIFKGNPKHYLTEIQMLIEPAAG